MVFHLFSFQLISWLSENTVGQDPSLSENTVAGSGRDGSGVGQPAGHAGRVGRVASGRVGSGRVVSGQLVGRSHGSGRVKSCRVGSSQSAGGSSRLGQVESGVTHNVSYDFRCQAMCLL